MAISGPGVEVNGGKLVFDGSAGGASVSINPVAISDAAATWFAIDFWLQPVALQTSSLQRILVLTTSSISVRNENAKAAWDWLIHHSQFDVMCSFMCKLDLMETSLSSR